MEFIALERQGIGSTENTLMLSYRNGYKLSDKLNLKNKPDVFDKFKPTQTITVFAVDKKRVIAFSTLLVDNIEEEMHIGRIEVDFDFRGKGIGRDLMEFMFTEARKVGIKSLSVVPLQNNDTFFEKMGFKRTHPNYMVKSLENEKVREE